MSSALHQQSKAILDRNLRRHCYHHLDLLHLEYHHYHCQHHNISDSKDLVLELPYRERLGTIRLHRDLYLFHHHHCPHNLSLYRNYQEGLFLYRRQDRHYCLPQNNPKYHLNRHPHPNGRKRHQNHHLNLQYH